LTNRDGVAEFSTLYPGWYQGRAIHIHAKVRLGGKVGGERYEGGHVSHTGQVFLPEDITAQIAKMEPYAQRLGVHRTTQSEDHVYTGQHGSAALAQMARIKKGSNADGFVATLQVAVERDATPRGVELEDRPYDR
jgi:protocatechuate 3,4-dioxygenase beta subunit